MEPKDIETADAQEELRRALRTASDFKRALDEHAIVAITDAAGKITYVNGKFCEISGYAESELLGRDHHIINSAYHPKAFFKDLWKTIASGSVWHGEIQNRRKDGTIYWVDTTIVPFLDCRGKPHQYIAIRADITERKKNEERLEAMARELDWKNNELQSMIRAVSHDLRSPLVNVQGFTAMLGKHVEGLIEIIGKEAEGSAPADSAIDEIGREMTLALGFVQAGAVKMDALLSGLLTFSRLGSTSLKLQDVDMNDVVASSLAAMKFQILNSRAEFTIHDLPMVRADRDLLERVFSNLFENALKFSLPGRLLALEISGELRGTAAVIRVSDNGMGMTETCRSRIFDLFYRINPTGSEGNGIGLAIVKAALERMGGSISVSSKIGMGSAFELTLPSCAQ